MTKVVRMGKDTREKRVDIFPTPSKATENRGWHLQMKYAHGTERMILWMQFTDLETMEEFGQRLVDYARENR